MPDNPQSERQKNGEGADDGEGADGQGPDGQGPDGQGAHVLEEEEEEEEEKEDAV